MHEGRFKIGTLAAMTGFGIPTLRNWERRFGLLEPQRVASGHRMYTADDLAALRRVRALLDEGRSIGEIASMGRQALLAADAQSREGRVSRSELLERVEPLIELIPYVVLDALPCGVLLTDVRGRTLWMNKRLERICGYELRAMRGRTPGSVLQGPQTDPKTVRKLSEAVAAVRACNVRILNYAPAQREYWADLEIVPFLLSAEPRGFIATVRDVTDEVTALGLGGVRRKR